ncbi:OLC1v1036557C1 [Oldenlandia corymbosa var. corymbosa]|uniref:OLC1v1036557C1 n=1 Tax=Oldenlandia corymbosa var. corymbosa TaxID=529605 RepID=A0AAV1CW88_OLDCO|nr:OLC1v1036557C1 [Oldenlandia corymbosa var. corymbosa]
MQELSNLRGQAIFSNRLHQFGCYDWLDDANGHLSIDVVAVAVESAITDTYPTVSNAAREVFAGRSVDNTIYGVAIDTVSTVTNGVFTDSAIIDAYPAVPNMAMEVSAGRSMDDTIFGVAINAVLSIADGVFADSAIIGTRPAGYSVAIWTDLMGLVTTEAADRSINYAITLLEADTVSKIIRTRSVARITFADLCANTINEEPVTSVAGLESVSEFSMHDGYFSIYICITNNTQILDKSNWLMILQLPIYNETHQLRVVCSMNPYTLSPEGMGSCHVDSRFQFGSVIVSRGDRGQLARCSPSMFNVSGLAEIDDNRSQFHTSMVNIEEMFNGSNKDMEAYVNDFQECVDLQNEYGESTSSEEVDKEIVCRDRHDTEPQDHDGLKDVDTILNDHGHSRHSSPVHQVSSSSPLEHEEQCCLNSAGVDFATTNFSKLSHQEQGRLIMLDSDETKDTSPTANETSMGLISIGRQHRVATDSASISSQFSWQDKSVLGTLSIDQAETSTTTSLAAGEASKGLICKDGNRTRQLDSVQISGSVFLQFKQLNQGCLKTQGKERANMGKTKLRKVESVLKKVVGCNEEQNRQTDSSGHRVGRTSTNSLFGADSLCIDAESDENQEEKYIAWVDYGATVEWRFKLTANQRILKSLAGQEKRRCTRAYAKLFGSTPKRIKAFYVEKIVAKKDDDMKLKVDENKEGNEDDRLMNDKAEIEVVKLIEKWQVELQLEGDNNHPSHALLRETGVALTINEEESCKQIDSDVVSVSDKEGAKENGSGTVSSAVVANPVLKQFGSQPQVPHSKMVTSPMNSQGQLLSKEVRSKDTLPGFEVQDVEKQKVNSTSSSPISNGRLSPKSDLSVNIAQEQKNRRSYLRWQISQESRSSSRTDNDFKGKPQPLQRSKHAPFFNPYYSHSAWVPYYIMYLVEWCYVDLRATWNASG